MRFIAILSTLLSFSAYGENQVVPKDIYEFIQSRGCLQVADFYNDRYSDTDPPYAIRKISRGKRDVVAWCRTDPKNYSMDGEYSLILRFDDPGNPLSKCPNRIDDIKSIGGLKFISITEKLSWYRLVHTKGKLKGEEDVSTIAISSTYDGVGYIFICVDGKWASRFTH